MADQIQTPNGLEAAETLADTNVMEVYQEDAGGERGNKQETLDVLRDYFQTLDSYTTGNLIKSGASGVPSDTGYNADTLYNKVNTDHEDRIGDNETNIDTNSDNIVTANANIAANVVDIATNVTDIATKATTDDDASFSSVTSGSSSLKWKRFTGTFDSSGEASFSHGLTAANIVGVCAVGNTTGEYRAGYFSSSLYISVQYDSTTMDVVGESSAGSYDSNAYAVTVFYY